MTTLPSGPHALVDLATDDPSSTAQTYERLLGSEVGRGVDDRRAVTVGNVVLSLRARSGESDTHDVYFTVDDVPASRRLLGRRGHPLSDSTLGALGDISPVGIAGRPESATPVDGDVTALDHLVFTCDNRDVAVALFAGTFDLDFRLDQPIGQDARQLFFRRGDLIVEVVAAPRPPADPVPASPVTLWGVAWRSIDVDATHARLMATGLDLSEIRVGRKKGTRIFTVRHRELATRTVVIGPDA
ncbi:VOC family protein [Gordonia sp. NPDC058843]|uniref:VOC family protein n=1 Tax=Gordonia sp. NPDC058843 TaxID=3346648 RepID=UPI003691765D